MGAHTIVWNVSDALYQEITQIQETLAFPQPTDVIMQAVHSFIFYVSLPCAADDDCGRTDSGAIGQKIYRTRFA